MRNLLIICAAAAALGVWMIYLGVSGAETRAKQAYAEAAQKGIAPADVPFPAADGTGFKVKRYGPDEHGVVCYTAGSVALSCLSIRR